MFNKIKIDRKFWINVTFFALGGILLVYLWFKYRVPPAITTDMEFKTLDGTPVKLSAFKGKTVFVNFWETWCGPCVEELPTIEAARMQLDSSKIIFITVSEEDPAKIKNFSAQHDYHFQYLISQKKFHELNINTYPTTYIIDKHGHVAFSEIGAADWSDVSTLARIEEIMQ
ncbi:MAG: TlpA family protein disulfide reductase [Bacteroidetes bacterium]|nr:TlpA family protein disulfide reductase [Bacteroidota bacterium]